MCSPFTGAKTNYIELSTTWVFSGIMLHAELGLLDNHLFLHGFLSLPSDLFGGEFILAAVKVNLKVRTVRWRSFALCRGMSIVALPLLEAEANPP